MTELEKALYADVFWLKRKLDQLRAVSCYTGEAKAAVVAAAVELEQTLRTYLTKEKR